MVCRISNVVFRAWQRRLNEIRGNRFGCWEEGGGKLICLQLLSLIACACLTGSITVNHCGSTRLLRRTIRSPSPPPQTNDLIRKRCMMGEPPEGSVLKPSDQGRCLRICLAAFGLRGPSSSATSSKTRFKAVMS